MNALVEKIRQKEFELRIFISLGIVILVCVLSFVIFKTDPPIYNLIWNQLGFEGNASSIVFTLLALHMLLLSAFRIWAGSLLTPNRVMAFKVQTDKLITKGPYALVRNPIYLVDWLAMCGFLIVLPPIGILLPVLFYIHYTQIIIYEEKSLYRSFSTNYKSYCEKVPRLFPNPQSIKHFIKSKKYFVYTWKGIRHNALYVLFVPGFIVSGITNTIFLALIIGLPGVIDWAIVHTKIGLGKLSSDVKQKVKNKKVFNDILYSQCWEDPQMDRVAFKINSADTVVTITSGGCNALTFLIDNPKKIIALDINPYQNYLLEFKIVVFKYLNYDSLLEILGVRKSSHRIKLYNRIRIFLSKDAKEYWDKNKKKIEKGLIHCGRYEMYMKLLRLSLGMLLNRALFTKFFEIENEKQKLYNDKWNNLRWRLFTKVLLSKKTMSLLFDKDFFKYLESDFSFGKHFAQKVEKALTKLSTKENYFLAYVLLGRFYDEKNLPYYLKPENYHLIKNRLDRIKIVTASCESYFSKLPSDSISKFNFTNIFEWISPEQYESLLRETIRIAQDGAIITYRNLLVPRNHPQSLNNKLYSLNDLAKALQEKDNSFIYNKYVIELVQKDIKKCNILQKKFQAEVS
jgi:S-adenosylmethionine-diacylglycerol 3-amino-3-carboxypropyl transferase